MTQRADVAAAGRKAASGYAIGDDKLSVFRSISAANLADLVVDQLPRRHTGIVVRGIQKVKALSDYQQKSEKAGAANQHNKKPRP